MEGRAGDSPPTNSGPRPTCTVPGTCSAPVPGLPGIDDLPSSSTGRARRLDTSSPGVAELIAEKPATQWRAGPTRLEWTRALEERTSIDPVLFGYQMRMNDSEAGAQKLLSESFDSPDKVVRFFIAALNDDREIADYTAKLGPYAELAANGPICKHLTTSAQQSLPPLSRSQTEPSPPTRPPLPPCLSKPPAGNLPAPHMPGSVRTGPFWPSRNRTYTPQLRLLQPPAASTARSAIFAFNFCWRKREPAPRPRAEVARRTGQPTPQSRKHRPGKQQHRPDAQTARARRDSAQLAYEQADAGLGPLSHAPIPLPPTWPPGWKV